MSSLMRISTGPLENHPLPLLIFPENVSQTASKEQQLRYLQDWWQEHRASMQADLHRYGAFLLRGFPIETPQDFEDIAKTIDPELKNNYLGTSPRDALTKYVFSASELPPSYPIPQHCEMSFVKNPPRHLFFSCLLAPQQNGETPLCDFRKVYRDLDPAVRMRFDTLGVQNIRNYAGPRTPKKFDLWQLKRWDSMFGTDDRQKVADICRENDFNIVWKEQDSLLIANTQPATRAHPVTGETVWFNHSQVFHWSAIPGEYAYIAKRQKRMPMYALEQVAKGLIAGKKRLQAPEEQAMHCTYGDGSPISDSDMDAVRAAIWKNLVIFPWQKGDVVVIDNFAVSHGRMPYTGPRQVVVAWA